MPKIVNVTTVELRDAISGAVSSILEAVVRTMEITPPELIPDIMQQGVALAGGGAHLPGLDRRMSQETKFPVFRADSPLTCVVRGCAEALTETRALAAGDGQVLAGRR